MNDWFRSNIEQMQGYTPGFQPADRTAIKINTNENPHPPSPLVAKALARLDDLGLRRYPPIMSNPVREVAARLHNVDPEQVLVGNGGDELLALMVRACCGPGRPLAYPSPTYSLYPTLAAIEEAPVIEKPWGPDGAFPEALLGVEAPLTILCNPNAPTTTFLPPEHVENVVRAARGIVLIDEAYVDFAPGDCLGLLARHENVAVLRSLSKGYSLAGMRCGYLVASRRIIDALVKIKDSYNVNIATQLAAAAALEDQAWFRCNRDRIVFERERLIPALRELGFEVPPSNTNFLLATIREPSAASIHQKLMAQNIYIRYFCQEPLTDKLRITVGTRAENDMLLAALHGIIED